MKNIIQALCVITRDLIDSGLSNVDFLVDLGCGQGRMMKMISDSEGS